jgi:hypothetical protein
MLNRTIIALNTGLEETGRNAGFQTAGNSANLITLIGQFINAILGLLGVVFLILMIYAGVLYMTSAGNPEGTKKAVGIIRNSVIGLIIILASYAITTFVIELILQRTLPVAA